MGRDAQFAIGEVVRIVNGEDDHGRVGVITAMHADDIVPLYQVAFENRSAWFKEYYLIAAAE